MAMSEAKLIEILKDSNSPIFDKAQACERLAVVGTKEAVPLLAALLADEHLADYGRFGLEPIPDPSVDDALRKAMEELQGLRLVGVVDSIGVRRDTKATVALAALLKNDDAEVAAAAAAALGQIGSPVAAKLLEETLDHAKAPLVGAAAGAALVCAERLGAQGNRKEAATLYAALRRPNIPKAVRVAADLGAEKAR